MCLEKSRVAEKLQGVQKPICLAGAHIRINLASCSSLATDTAPLPGLCCCAWEGSAGDRAGPGGTITPHISRSRCVLVCAGGAARSTAAEQGVLHTPHPLPWSESEETLLQAALELNLVNSFSAVILLLFRVAVAAAWSPGVCGGACPAALCQNNAGSCW